jgi:hypothetical protein
MRMTTKKYIKIILLLSALPAYITLYADSSRYRSGTGLMGLHSSIERPESGIPHKIIQSNQQTETYSGSKDDGNLAATNSSLTIEKNNIKSIDQKSDDPKSDDQKLNDHNSKKPNGKKQADPEKKSESKKTLVKTRYITGFPSNTVPTPRKEFIHKAPDYYEGIYLNNHVAQSSKKYTQLMEKAAELKMNTIVVDVQPKLPSADFIKTAKAKGLYLVSRVVVFDGGLKEYPPDIKHISDTLTTAEESVKSGFMEVQLDYIRFADYTEKMQVSKEQRYRLLSGILRMATDRLRPYGVRVGADTFGRISFNKDDIIGQKIEVFSPHIDSLYPMLYPSHFYGEPDRIKDPYKTVYDGVKNSKDRADENTRVIAYIQGFKTSIPNKLNYQTYIQKQIQAVYDGGGDGYIVWNPGTKYDPFFAALQEHRKSLKK